MKQVNVVLSTVLVFLLFATGVVFNACVKDPCKDLICKNNGVCRDGRCKCPNGFEGPHCEEKTYEKFIGTWQGTYRCNGEVPAERTVIIAPGDKPFEATMYNIFTQTQTLLLELDGDKITIPDQTVNDIEYKGTGYVEGIYITLFVEEHNTVSNEYSSCVLNATKFIQP